MYGGKSLRNWPPNVSGIVSNFTSSGKRLLAPDMVADQWGTDDWTMETLQWYFAFRIQRPGHYRYNSSYYIVSCRPDTSRAVDQSPQAMKPPRRVASGVRSTSSSQYVFFFDSNWVRSGGKRYWGFLRASVCCPGRKIPDASPSHGKFLKSPQGFVAKKNCERAFFDIQFSFNYLGTYRWMSLYILNWKIE